MMSTISPTPPLGPYPHDRLWGQIGIIPTNASIKIMSKIVPIDMIHPPLKNVVNALSRRLPTPPPLKEVEQHNNNSKYQQDMNEPSQRVTADQSQHPQNYQYHGNCPQHRILLFLSVGEDRDYETRLRRCHNSFMLKYSFLVVLLLKILPDFRGNLAICHVVNCFHSLDEAIKFVSFKTFFQLALCLARAKY